MPTGTSATSRTRRTEYPLPLFIRCRILFDSGFKETADGVQCQWEHQQPAELAVQNIRCLFSSAVVFPSAADLRRQRMEYNANGNIRNQPNSPYRISAASFHPLSHSLRQRI
jgi:hypothetical protein